MTASHVAETKVSGTLPRRSHGKDGAGRENITNNIVFLTDGGQEVIGDERKHRLKFHMGGTGWLSTKLFVFLSWAQKYTTLPRFLYSSHLNSGQRKVVEVRGSAPRPSPFKPPTYLSLFLHPLGSYTDSSPGTGGPK